MILLMGIAGSGKGTQGKILAESANFQVISTGDLLRQYGSDDQHAKMHSGEILGDQEVTELLEKALSDAVDLNKVILDGYPRRVSQAEWLLDEQCKGRLQIDAVIHLMADREAVKKRLLDRARHDDHDKGIEQRFDEYTKDTAPIIDFLKTSGIKVFEVDAEGSVEQVRDRIQNCLSGDRSNAN